MNINELDGTVVGCGSFFFFGFDCVRILSKNDYYFLLFRITF